MKGMKRYEGLDLDPELMELWNKLKRLHYKLREYTKKRYNRVNPFIENLFKWGEKGGYFKSKNTIIYDSTTIIGDVEIGDNCWVGPFCSIDGSGGLKIGNYVTISTGCRIMTHDSIKRTLSGGKFPIERKSCEIGNYTFIGVESTILKGVKIGHHCLIGANSLVNKSVPDFSIVAGSPAKIIGKVIVKDDDVIWEMFKDKK